MLRKIIFFIIFGSFLSLLVIDYSNFNSNSRESFIYRVSETIDKTNINTSIIGDYYIPKSIIVNMINNNDYDRRYDLLIKDLKIITISNKNKLIVVREESPLFYDSRYIYLSSKNQIDSDLNIIGMKDLPMINLNNLYDNKRAYNQSINKIRNFTNYLKNNYTDLYDNLDSMTYDSNRGDRSPHLSFGIFISGCKVLLSDGFNNSINLEQEEFEYKIDILRAALDQYPKKIDEISEIDLRYSDFYEIFFN